MSKRLYTGIIASFMIILLITSCLSFDSVIQPTDAIPNSSFQVEIAVRSSGGLIPSSAYFGVALPEGWLVQNNRFPFTGDFQGNIYYSSALTYQMEQLQPAASGYYWWVGESAATTSATDDRYIGTMTVLTDEKEGSFYLDYMIGNSNDGLNQDQSNNHRVTVVATDIDELAKENIRIYAAQNHLNIKTPSMNKAKEVMIYTLTGKLISYHRNGNLTSLPCGHIREKLVIVKLKMENDSFVMRKVLLQ